MNAILRFPPSGTSDAFGTAEGTVATMATLIRNVVENRGECLDADLERAGFSPEEIREYGPIARARVAPQLIVAGLLDDLADLPAPSQAEQFAPAPSDPLAAIRELVAAAEEAGWDVSENRDVLDAARNGYAALSGAPATADPVEADAPPFALPLRVVDCRGALVLEAADGENLIRVQSMSKAKRARLAFIAKACNAMAGGGRA